MPLPAIASATRSGKLFFKSLDDLRVLLGVLRARAHMRKAELLEGTANRYLVEIDIEAFLDDASEVDAAPPHHAIAGGIRSGFHDPLQLLFLLGRQFRAGTGSLGVDQPLGTPLVVPMRPVAQRLPIHRSNLGGGLTAHPVEHRRQRQQAPRLICILRPLRQHPQLARTEVRAQSYRRAHRPLANQSRSYGMEPQAPGGGESHITESPSTKVGIRSCG
jgi:hypothetical protein